MSELTLVATSSFGLEAIVKREVEALGFTVSRVENGKVLYAASEDAITESNLWLRTADRVLLLMGEFKARSFDELFEGTRKLPWDQWITKDGKFTVTGKSVKSRLHSVPDCQSVVKKAVVENLKTRYETDWFKEDGPSFTIQVSILKDTATLTIDTSGQGLHKRGYRKSSTEAPLKETLAAAMIQLSYWKTGRLLVDPFCGSGTIPIEAAMIGRNIAPGLHRAFAAETWPRIGKKRWDKSRANAKAMSDYYIDLAICASDHDDRAVAAARDNAARALVSDTIRYSVNSFADAELSEDYGIVITNPPYGERIGKRNEVEQLYQTMGARLKTLRTWSVYILTSHDRFEQLYGRKAHRRRKLYNGRIKVDYYQYYGTRPPS